MEPTRSEAGRAGDAVGFAAAVFGQAELGVDARSVGLLLQLEIDHAGDRIRSVDRRGRAAEDFDALDQADRDVGDIGDVAVAAIGHREIRDAAAINQHQRVVGAETAQIDLFRARRESIGAVALRALRLAGVLRDRFHQLGHVLIALLENILRADHRDRGRTFLLRSRNARTDHHDFLLGTRKELYILLKLFFGLGGILCRSRSGGSEQADTRKRNGG